MSIRLRRNNPLRGLAVVALVLGGHAAVFAAIALNPAPDVPAEPEPMMVSLVAESEPVQAELQARHEPAPVPPRPRKPEMPAERQPPLEQVVQPMPQPALSKNEPKAESVPPAHRDEVAEAAPAQTPAQAGPVVQKVAAEPEPDYQPPRFGVAYLHNPSPEYPPISRRLREQGKVMLRVMVTATGEPAAVELDQSSGFERLDLAAMEAVRQWRFVPAKRGDQAVSAWVVVPLSFSVKG